MSAVAWLIMVAVRTVVGAAADDSDYRIERVVVARGSDDWHFGQCRPVAMPGGPPRVIVTMQEAFGRVTHDYHDWFQAETMDLGKTWTAPARIEPLRRVREADGYEIVIGDLVPQWHAKSGTVLATGLTFDFAGGKTQDTARQHAAYAVYDPKTGAWSGMRILALPELDRSGAAIRRSCCGGGQWCELPDGDILLPFRYIRPGDKEIHTSAVALCSFDGTTLRYKEHGTALTLRRKRGLGEPSLARCGSRYFLTLRNDDGGWVTRGTDGIRFEPIRPWTFDNGKPLGSYNTQQHWVTHGEAIFLVYTRRGAGNDHIFRHRAPLFMARVDPERVCVLRRTERVVIPEEGYCLGNFGVSDVGPNETWVVAGEDVNSRDKKWRSKPGSVYRVLAARIRWAEVD